MPFNPDKCKVIRIIKKRQPIDANYSDIKNAKYLAYRHAQQGYVGPTLVVGGNVGVDIPTYVDHYEPMQPCQQFLSQDLFNNVQWNIAGILCIYVLDINGVFYF